jgi:predicted nucleic acid-binding protein
MNILVDTSVWSAALRRPTVAKLSKEQQQAVGTLSELVRDGRAVLIGAIRQELLSGIKLQAQFETLRSALMAFEDVLVSRQDYELGAQLFNTCRTHGVQGSNTDFLICAVSMNHALPILSLDNDFVNYQACVPIRLFTN